MESFFLDEGAYRALLELLNNQYATERAGKKLDMVFLHEDYWLKDTAVISSVVAKKGMWEIYLVFANHARPHQLIRRVIGQFANQRVANISAHYMERMAAKDQRGTLQINSLLFNIAPS